MEFSRAARSKSLTGATRRRSPGSVDPLALRGSTVLVALTVSLLIVTAPRAQALVKRTAESEVQTGQWFSVAVARCRADERVVSGGYRLDPDSGNSPATSRAKGKRAWTVTAFENDFIAYALCTRRYKPAKVAETVAFGDSS